MTAPERSPERDQAIEAMLPHVAVGGWTTRTLLEAAGPDTDLLFPRGAVDMIEPTSTWPIARWSAVQPGSTCRAAICRRGFER